MAKIAVTENSKEEIFPINEDGSLSLLVLKEKIPNVIGLRYRYKGRLRAVRICSNYFFLPTGVSWEKYVFHCVFDDNSEVEEKKTNINLSTYYDLVPYDMIVMGLPDNIESNEFNAYFSEFGKLSICELKKDSKTGRSKGYGFLKYINFDDQYNCINSELKLKDTVVHLRLPTYHLDETICDRRILISNITPSVTMIDLLEYFNVFGKITEIFMPNALVPYAFITFAKSDAVVNVFKFGESHRVFGGFVFVERLKSKKELEDAQHRKDPTEYKNKKPDDIRVKAISVEGTLSAEKMLTHDNHQNGVMGSDRIPHTNLVPPPLTLAIDRTCPPPAIPGTGPPVHFTGPPPSNGDEPPQVAPLISQMLNNQNNFDGRIQSNDYQNSVDSIPQQNNLWNQMQMAHNGSFHQINSDGPSQVTQQFSQQNTSLVAPQFYPQMNFDASSQVVQQNNGSSQFNHQINFDGAQQIMQQFSNQHNGPMGSQFNHQNNFEGPSQVSQPVVQQNNGPMGPQFNHQNNSGQQNNGPMGPQFNHPMNFECSSQMTQQGGQSNNGPLGPQFNHPINFEGPSQMTQQGGQSNNNPLGLQFNHQINFEGTPQRHQQNNGPMGPNFHSPFTYDGQGHQTVQQSHMLHNPDISQRISNEQNSMNGPAGLQHVAESHPFYQQGYIGGGHLTQPQHNPGQFPDMAHQISNQFNNFDTVSRMNSNYGNGQQQCQPKNHQDQQCRVPNILQGAPQYLPVNQAGQDLHGIQGKTLQTMNPQYDPRQGHNPQFMSTNHPQDGLGSSTTHQPHTEGTWDCRPVSAPQIHNIGAPMPAQPNYQVIIGDPTHRRTSSAELRSPTMAYQSYPINHWNVPNSFQSTHLPGNQQPYHHEGPRQMQSSGSIDASTTNSQSMDSSSRSQTDVRMAPRSSVDQGHDQKSTSKDDGGMLPLQLVSDVTMRLLKTCNSEAEKKILAKLLLSVMSEPAASTSESSSETVHNSERVNSDLESNQ